MVTFEEIEKAEVTDLSLGKRIEAFYKGSDALSNFAENIMIPVLNGQFKFNEKETAIVGSYYRMYAWMRSIVAMNSRIHFQGVASATRSLFELLLDIKILVGDKTGEIIEKFHAFPEIEKFRVADNIVSFCNKNKGEINLNYSHQQSFISSPNKGKFIEQLIIKHWGKTKKGKPNRPDHWSGKSVKDRALSLGLEYEELYVDVYPLLSWHIHAGSTGYTGLKEETIESCFGYCHSIAQKIFLDATIICAKEIKITDAIDDFYKTVENLRLVPGQILVEEQIKILEKAQKTKSL